MPVENIYELPIKIDMGESGRPKIHIGDGEVIPPISPAEARKLAATLEQVATTAEYSAVLRHVLLGRGQTEEELKPVVRAAGAVLNELRTAGEDAFPWKPVE